MIRDWKYTITVIVVGLALLIAFGVLLLTNSNSDTEPTVMFVETPELTVASVPTPTPPQITCLAGSVPRTSINGTVTCVIAPSPVVPLKCRLSAEDNKLICEEDLGECPSGYIRLGENCEVMPCPPDATSCPQGHPMIETELGIYESGYNTAAKYCNNEMAVAPPLPPREMSNTWQGFIDGLNDVCGYIPGIYAAPTETLCADGWVSQNTGSGTCSWHGGIAY